MTNRAVNDFETVQCWLNEYKNPPSTYRTYQKEVERRKRAHKHFAEEQKIKVQERILDKEEINAILNAIDSLPEKDQWQIFYKKRTEFLVTILYFLGLRIHELESHTWNAFRQVQGKWWFFLIGKGGKFGKIPVNNELLEAVVNYRRHLNYPPYPEPDEQVPIISSWHSANALTARQMNKLLKHVALLAAEQFHDKPDKIAKLKKFSAHWLRHLSASMQDLAGISFKHIRANLRHENDETTRRYVHALDDERHDDMQKLSLRFSDVMEKNSAEEN